MSLTERVEPTRISKQRSRLVLGLQVIAIGVVAFGYLFFIRKYTSPYAGGSDESGYLNIARLFQQGKFTRPVSEIPGLEPPVWNSFFQQPLGFIVDAQNKRMMPTYPIGLPLHLWAASAFVGLEYATMLVNVLVCFFAAILMVGLGRIFGLPWGWALAGAAILWACPLFVTMALRPMSDVPAMVWCMAAIWPALIARERWPWATIAGMAFAVAVLLRPSNLLLLIPIALILGLKPRAWAVFILGGLPGAVLLGWYNFRLYGTAITTGYGDVRSAFAWTFVPHNAVHVLKWITLLLSPLFLLSLVGLAWTKQETKFAIRLLVIWAGVFLVFYLFYYHTGETWWYLRFLLPVFPALILLGLFGARALTENVTGTKVRRCVQWGALVSVLLFQGWLGRDLHAGEAKHYDTVYVQLVNWMRANAPANAIVMQMQSSGAFLFYTDFTLVRWDLITPQAQQKLYTVARTSGRPIYAVLFDYERNDAFGRLTGVWKPLVRFGHTGIWQLEPDSADTP